MSAMLDQLAAAVRGSGQRQVVSVALEAIEPDPEQPRKTFSEIEGLAASIRGVGIKQPLLVRSHPEERGRFVLVAGERRYLAAQKAGLKEVPCLLEEGENASRGGRLVTMLVENLQREDVPVLETAKALETALGELEVAKGELARLLGKPASFVSKHLALLQAEGPGREALEEGRIQSPETFRLFAALESAAQGRLLATARQEDRPITRSEVSRAPSTRRKPKRKARKNAPRAKLLKLELRPDQVGEILRRFGVEPPKEPAKLVSSLLKALGASRAERAEATAGSAGGSVAAAKSEAERP